MVKGKKIVATIEARMASTRLPGKIMFPFAGKPGLQMMIERIKRASLLDEVVVATTTNSKDDVIVELCRRLQVSHYRGRASGSHISA